jgi:hypothetical protein
VGYRAAFIEIAPDSGASRGGEPPQRDEKRSVARIEFDLISSAPYVHTEEDVQYAVHLERSADAGVPALSRVEFFSKSHACMRASALPKRYGWGVHFDSDGRVALVPVSDERYRELACDPGLSHLFAMRSKRART